MIYTEAALVSTARVIPIRLIAGGGGATADAHVRLERAGFMRMMMIGEPRLSEFVRAYQARGYEVEVVPYRDEDAGGETIPDCATVYIRKAI